MASLFNTISGCTTGGAPPTKEAYEKDVARILGMLNASETCTRDALEVAATAAESYTSSSRAVVAAGGHGVGAVGFGWGERSGQVTTQVIDSQLLESGCGSVFANVNDILVRMRRISCNVAQNMTQSTSEVSTNASVVVRVEPTDGAYERLLQSRELTLQLFAALPDSHAAKIEALSAQLERQSQEIQEFGRIEMESTVVKVSAGTRITVLSTTVQKLASLVSQDVKDIAKSAAVQVLEQEFGLMANSPNVKSLVNEEIERHTDDINTEIAQNVSTSRVEVSDAGNVTITSPFAISLSNTELTVDANVELMSTTLVTSAVDLGKQVASQVISAASGGTAVTQQSKGVEALAREFGTANTDAVATQQEAHVNLVSAANETMNALNPFAALAGVLGSVGGVVVVVILAVVLLPSLSGGGGGGAPSDGGVSTVANGTGAASPPFADGVPLGELAPLRGQLPTGARSTTPTSAVRPSPAIVPKVLLGLVVLTVAAYIYQIVQSPLNIFSLWPFATLFCLIVVASVYCRRPPMLPLSILACLASS